MPDAMKAQAMQKLMCPEFTPSRECESTLASFAAQDERAPTYMCCDRGILGCAHYARACKVLAPCCGRFHTCRKCHDETSDHDMPRGAVDTIMCMRCWEVQPVAKHCRHAACADAPDFAEYFCRECRLYASVASSNIYHCGQCGVCRLGDRDNFIHCATCNVCIWRVGFERHQCVANSHDANCPICHEGMSCITCDQAVAVLPCGHPMHKCCLGRIHAKR